MVENAASPQIEQPAVSEKIVNRPRVDLRIFPGAGFGFQSNLQESPKAFMNLKGIDVKDSRVWNSMASADEVIPHRFRHIAEDLRTVLQNHNDNEPEARLAVVIHSIAGGEFGNVLQELRKLDPELLKKRINNIDFVMLGAMGLEGGIGNVRRDIQKRTRLMNSQLDTEKAPTDRVAGVESLLFIPAQNPACQDALEIAAQLFGEDEAFSEVKEQSVGFKPDNRYFESLAPEKKTELLAVESRLADIITRIKKGAGSKEEFQNCLNERAALLIPDAQKVYHNELGNPATNVEYQKALIEKTGMARFTQSLLGLADTARLGLSIVTAKLRREFKDLMKLGLKPEQIKFLATKWDVFRPPKQVKKQQQSLTRKEQSPELYELANSTHSSWMFFADQFAQAVEQIYVEV